VATKPHPRRRPSKYALPDIETKPARASTVRTKAEHDADVRAFETGTQARIARAQGRARKNEAAIEKERRQSIAARTPPPPPRPRRPDVKPKDGGNDGAGRARARGTTPARGRRRSGKGLGGFKLPGLPNVIRGNPRSILVAEMVGTSVVVTAGRLGRGEAPELGDYVPVWLVYLVLAFAVTISKGTERVAIGLGGLILVAVTLRDAAPLTRALAVASTGGGAATRGRGGQGVPSAGPGSGVRTFGPRHGSGPHPGGPRSNRG
jgi:hypothetical protein